MIRLGELGLPLQLLITVSYHIVRGRLSDVGEDVVGVVALLVFLMCIVSLFSLGMQTVSSHRHERAKRKRRKFQERRA